MCFLSFNFKLCAFCFTLVFTVSCSNNTTSPSQVSFEGNFNQAGLKERTVNSFNLFKDSLYASTDEGLHKPVLGKKDNTWASLGMKDENVVDVVFLPQNKLLIAIRHKIVNEGKPTLFLSRDKGQNWYAYLNNFGGKKGEYTYVASLASISKPSSTLLAHTADRTIARSVNGGKHWKIVQGKWNHFGGAQKTIYKDAYHSKTVWASGANPFEVPYLLRSTNSGKSWKNFETVGKSGQICYNVVSHPDNQDDILAGLVSSFTKLLQIRKSTDGGQSWKTVLEGIAAFTLTNSGRNAAGTLFFAASGDFGDSWEIVEWKNSPPGVQVNDMVSVIKNDREVLYF